MLLKNHGNYVFVQERATNISVPSYVAASMRKITHPSTDAKEQFSFHSVLGVLNYLWELFVGIAENHPKMLTASPNITSNVFVAMTQVQ